MNSGLRSLAVTDSGITRNFKIQHKRQMIGEPDTAENGEVPDPYIIRYQYKVQLLTRIPGGVGRSTAGISATQTGFANKFAQLSRTFEGIEIPGHYNWLAGHWDEARDGLELLFPCMSIKGQVNQKNADIIDLAFHHKALESPGQIMIFRRLHRLF